MLNMREEVRAKEADIVLGLSDGYYCAGRESDGRLGDYFCVVR